MRQLILRVASSTIVILGVPYLWGNIFHQVDLSDSGFIPALFPIGPQDTYISGFLALLAVITYPMGWLNQLPIGWTFGIFAFAAALPYLAAWIWKLKPVRSRIHRVRLYLSPDDSNQASFYKTGSRWALILWSVLFGIPAAMILISFAALVVIGPPLAAAHARAHDNWEKKGYLQWPVVDWVDENGKLNQGHLKTCSPQWCALIQDDRSITVPAAAVKKAEQVAPMSSTTTHR